MAEHVDAAAIAELERAELAARERRLTAEAEAERLIEVARLAASRIEADVDERVAVAVDVARRERLAGAAAEVAAIDAELARLDSAPAGDRVRPAGFEAAVEHVVAAVLGEPDG